VISCHARAPIQFGSTSTVHARVASASAHYRRENRDRESRSKADNPTGLSHESCVVMWLYCTGLCWTGRVDPRWQAKQIPYPSVVVSSKGFGLAPTPNPHLLAQPHRKENTRWYSSGLFVMTPGIPFCSLFLAFSLSFFPSVLWFCPRRSFKRRSSRPFPGACARLLFAVGFPLVALYCAIASFLNYARPSQGCRAAARTGVGSSPRAAW
jgi:hypothetical protein